MILLPFCAPPTRLSTIYAFILLGVMLDGISRWQFDSILQTVAEIARDGAVGTELPTFAMDGYNMTVNATTLATETVNRTISVMWNAIPAEFENSWNGFQLIVDDGKCFKYILYIRCELTQQWSNLYRE
jgi:hypothetical protein